MTLMLVLLFVRRDMSLPSRYASDGMVSNGGYSALMPQGIQAVSRAIDRNFSGVFWFDRVGLLSTCSESLHQLLTSQRSPLT